MVEFEFAKRFYTIRYMYFRLIYLSSLTEMLFYSEKTGSNIFLKGIGGISFHVNCRISNMFEGFNIEKVVVKKCVWQIFKQSWHVQWNIANVNGELKRTTNIQISKEDGKKARMFIEFSSTLPTTRKFITLAM